MLDFIARRLEEIETMDGKEFYDIIKGEAHCKEIEEKAKAKAKGKSTNAKSVKEKHVEEKQSKAKSQEANPTDK